ncbi:MAG: LVIVD repeat-containing protein [Pseudolabrys sp.]
MSQPQATAKGIRLLSRDDQGGRPDGVQVIVHKGHAFIGHMFADGFSVVDVRDPKKPKTAAFVAAPKNTRSHHLQIAGDVLMVVNGPNIWAMQQYASQADYYAKSLADSVTTEQPFGAGVRTFDISNPASPREIGYLHMPGFGAHRIWWVGDRYAYVSVHFEGFIDHALAIVDMADPAKPKLAGRWWLPGMNRAAGEEKPASFGKRTALHHLISAGNIGYAAWRDGGYTIHDLSDPANPKLLAHRNYSPPFGGGAHTPLPLPGKKLLVLADEATSNSCANGLAYTWVIDVREPSNPVSIATLPTPAEEDFCAKGAKFGPHNLHENRPGSFQSEDTAFATYHNAGLRVYDVRNAFEPKELAYFVPPPPERIVDQRPNPAKIIQSCDVYVDTNGVMYLTDTNAGLYILQYDGVK